MRKLHENLARAATSVLESVLLRQQRASRTLAKTVQLHPKWGSRDRKVLYTIVYDILRWKRYYAYLLDPKDENPTIEKLLGCWCVLKDFVWDQANPTDGKKKLSLYQSTSLPIAVKASFPDWLFKLGNSEIPSEWEKEFPAMNSQAGIALRINRIRSHPIKVQALLKDQFRIPSEYQNEYPDALLLTQGRKLEKNPLFLKGFFEIQDIHSQKIAPFTQAQPKDCVIDLCAGAGGKSLHLAARMRNQGVIRAYDVDPNKLKELVKRAKRAGATLIKTHCIRSNTDLTANDAWADVVLIDAPCSGLGTLKRNPEIKWRLTPAHLQKLLHTQAMLLDQAAGWVKPNGRLVYATCSVLPSENKQQIAQFLQRHPEFQLEIDQTYFCHQSDFDGFYMARLQKKHNCE